MPMQFFFNDWKETAMTLGGSRSGGQEWIRVRCSCRSVRTRWTMLPVQHRSYKLPRTEIYLDHGNLLFLTVGNGPQCTPHLAVRNTVKGFASGVQRLGCAIRTPPKIPRYSSPFSVVPGLVNVTRVESCGPCAENKTVTGTTFMRFRGPGALDDNFEDIRFELSRRQKAGSSTSM